MDRFSIWLPVIAVVLVFYALWCSGYLVVNRKRAVLFVGSLPGKSRCGAKFSSCTGYMKRVIRFKESRSYEFDFQSTVTKGFVAVEVQDRNKEIILQLNKNVPKGTVAVSEKQRYYLVFRFENADGAYELRWE